MQKPSLSIIICSSGREKSLHQCLRSLKKQSHQAFEVVVVSKKKPNFSPFPKLNIGWVEDPAQGLSQARDLGWRKAKGEIVSWIDDDVVLSQDWAQAVVKIFAENQDVGGVSGPTIVPKKLLKNRLVFWWYQKGGLLARFWVKFLLDDHPYRVGTLTKRGWWSPGSNFKQSLQLRGLWEVDFLEACNMSLRRELVKEVGGFDLGYKGTSEWCELDLAIKVKKLGYRLVWHRKVKLEHRVSQQGAYKNRRNIPERIKNYLKFRSRWLRLQQR